jgi:hypothetical protein
MERKISSFKRNRRRHSSFDSKEAREAKGDEDDVADENESDDEVRNSNSRDRQNNRDEESDVENVKKGAGKHRIRKGSGKWEHEPQEYQDDYKSGEEHPEWRSNWRPWLRAKAIRGDGGSSERSSDKHIDNEGADDEQPERRIHRSRKSRNDNDGDKEENNDDDTSER